MPTRGCASNFLVISCTLHKWRATIDIFPLDPVVFYQFCVVSRPGVSRVPKCPVRSFVDPMFPQGYTVIKVFFTVNDELLYDCATTEPFMSIVVAAPLPLCDCQHVSSVGNQVTEATAMTTPHPLFGFCIVPGILGHVVFQKNLGFNRKAVGAENYHEFRTLCFSTVLVFGQGRWRGQGWC